MEINTVKTVHNHSPQTLRPEISPFVYYLCAKITLVWLLLLAGACLTLRLLDAGAYTPIALLLFLLVTALTFIARLFQYEKEHYELHPDRFIYKGGGLASDFERELIVKNVTHVTVRQPFLENLIFKTGSVSVQSAGALDTEIHLKNISDPVGVYQRILAILRQNGFQLSRENIVQKEHPHRLAVFFEVFRNTIGALLFLVYITLDIIEDKDIDAVKVWAEHMPLIIALALVVLAVWIIFTIIHFLDLMRREYRLYDDTIEYTEGFLNRQQSVIPMENLSDSEITQSFISKMFGLYDIKLSCQGSNQEILFKNIANGDELSKNIDRLVAQKRSLVQARKETPAAPKTSGMGGSKPFQREIVYDREYTAEFRMKALRLWVPVLVASPILLLLFPIGILVIIRTLIAQNCNTFYVKADGFSHHYQLLASRVREFSLEKVTGIVFRRGIWDRLLGTCSITFWSIGSGQNIVFQAIPYDEQLVNDILGKKGLHPEEELHTLNSHFRITDFFKANLILGTIYILATLSLFGLHLAAGLAPTVIAVLWLWFKAAYYGQNLMIFYRDYVHFHQGLVHLEDVYSLYDDIKDITTIRYPFSRMGNILFNVAGETISPLYASQVQANPNVKLSPMLLTSNQFKVHYVDNIPVMDEMIDTIFYKRPGSQEIKLMMQNPVDTSFESLHVSRPALGNTLAKHGCWLLPFDALAVVTLYYSFGRHDIGALSILFGLNAAILGSIIAGLLVVSNRIAEYRVLQRSGVLFKKQISVTYNKIDFVNMDQNLGNKIFGNGNVTINTVGSSKAELVIKNIPDFRQFYDMLKNKYEQS